MGCCGKRSDRNPINDDFGSNDVCGRCRGFPRQGGGHYPAWLATKFVMCPSADVTHYQSWISSTLACPEEFGLFFPRLLSRLGLYPSMFHIRPMHVAEA